MVTLPLQLIPERFGVIFAAPPQRLTLALLGAICQKHTAWPSIFRKNTH